MTRYHGGRDRRALLGLLIAAWLAAGAGPAKPLKPLAVPRDRAAWEAKRAEILHTVRAALGPGAARPDPLVVTTEGQGDWTRPDGLIQRGLVIHVAPGETLGCMLLIPPGATSVQRVPGILFLGDGSGRAGGPLVPVFGEPAPAVTLARRGFAVLVVSAWPRAAAELPPWSAPPGKADQAAWWPRVLRDDQAALETLFAQPEVDPKRVGATGAGVAGMRSWWLEALDERVVCGVAVGGVCRISDWQAAQGAKAPPFAPWAATLLQSFDNEGVMALCAPRHLQIYGGDHDPLAPESGFLTLRNTALRVYAATGLSQFGNGLFSDLGGEFTLLAWDGVLEIFDHDFLHQGPTPLSHPAEPEPLVDEHWVNPAEFGLAGWMPEMSQRPGTWTWHDGVITCKPGPFEYGWLRMPVELDDFLLQLEWKVPKKGNTGIFLRAKPVAWTFPPSEKNKQRVATLGLDWPSRTGLELQAQDDPGIADKYSSGSLYRHAAPAANPTKPPGEWNRYTVRCRGPRVEVWINGQEMLDTTIDRYVTLRHPPLKGYIGFQNHGIGAEFRNVRYLALGNVSARAPRP
jgi:hypothetical protein